MTLVSSLNLVPVVKPTEQNPVVGRRQRLVRSIERQISLIENELQGTPQSYSGRKAPSWYWMDESSTWFCAVKYAKKPLELAKGKYAIQCTSLEDIAESLGVVKEYVLRGEFDDKLEAVAKGVRRNFKR